MLPYARCITVLRRFLLLTTCALALPAAADEYRISPVPDWVRPLAPDTSLIMPAEELSSGLAFLLSDEQIREAPGERHRFRHLALRAVSSQGLETIGSIELVFNPAHQQLSLHAIDILRDGQRQPRLANARIKVLQRETDLAHRILDGRKTLHIALDDVRVGDILEYAYSVQGQNPVFGERSFGGMDLGWQVPVGHLHARLLVPAGKNLAFSQHLTQLKPRKRTQGGMQEYVWEQRQLAGIPNEPNVPGWHQVYPWVQWSDYRSWRDVVDWAMPLYATSRPLGKALDEQLARIAASSADPHQRTAQVLRLVQHEIRYLGIAIGTGSHVPSAPEDVWQRRFGDCKDKTLLMISMLRALGIEAQAALVNTETRRGLDKILPSPGAFDHVLVRAVIKGQQYWLDPTLAPQEGPLDGLYQPDFGKALVVAPGRNDLQDMLAPEGARIYRKHVVTEYDSRAGLDKPARFTVRSEMRGLAAERDRSTFSQRERSSLQQDYLNYYAGYYPGIRVAKPMELIDEPAQNKLTVIEHYELPDFWARDEERKRLRATGHVPDMEEFLRRPSTTIRRNPLSLRHPLDISVETIWRLPEAWTVKDDQSSVEHAAFRFDSELRTADEQHTVIERNRYVSRADHVAADAVKAYADKLDQARQTLGTTLTKRDTVEAAASHSDPASPARPLQDRINWSVAMLALFGGIGCVWLCMRIYRHDPPAPFQPRIDAPSGLGGWLLLPAIGFCLQPVMLLKDMPDFLNAYTVETWQTLTTVGQSGYHALWAPLLLGELFVLQYQIGLSILLLVLFFGKRSSLPRVYILGNGLLLAFSVLDSAAISMAPTDVVRDLDPEWTKVIRFGLSYTIWTTYFCVSERVKATFRNTLKPRHGHPGGARQEPTMQALPTENQV